MVWNPKAQRNECSHCGSSEHDRNPCDSKRMAAMTDKAGEEVDEFDEFFGPSDSAIAKRIEDLQAELAAEKVKGAQQQIEIQALRWYRDQALVSANMQVAQLEDQVRQFREHARHDPNCPVVWRILDADRICRCGLGAVLAATEPKEEKTV